MIVLQFYSIRDAPLQQNFEGNRQNIYRAVETVENIKIHPQARKPCLINMLFR
jgi:hypothetical protein